MDDRRRATRKPLDLLFNQFLDGHPYLCRAVDLSASGVLCDVFTDRMTWHEAYPLELELPGAPRRLSVWGRRVRAEGRRLAIRFVALEADDRRLLSEFLAPQPA
ncbi:MAG: PilZ domain-containing protein [Deltaproteobacteria bacterium]|nr:PilZ domain-containing protein [Deltaproteobacteria bacterium]